MSADDVIPFGTLHPDGTMTNPRIVRHSDVGKCPFLILVPEHYRDDGSCRCDDPDHREMAEWGYSWDETARRWTV